MATQDELIYRCGWFTALEASECELLLSEWSLTMPSSGMTYVKSTMTKFTLNPSQYQGCVVTLPYMVNVCRSWWMWLLNHVVDKTPGPNTGVVGT